MIVLEMKQKRGSPPYSGVNFIQDAFMRTSTIGLFPNSPSSDECEMVLEKMDEERPLLSNI